MTSWLRRFFSPPLFPEDEDKSRVARILNIILFTILGLGLGFGLLAPYTAAERMRFWGMIGPFILIFFVFMVLLRRGFVRLASVLTLVVLWLLFAVSSYLGGGTLSPAFPGFVIAVVLAGVLLDNLAIFITIAASFLLGMGFAWLNSIGRLPAAPVYDNPWLALSYSMASLLLSGVLLALAYQSKRESYQRARSELAERQRAENQLRVSEEKLLQALDSARMGAWEWNIQARTITFTGNFPGVGNVAGDQFEHNFSNFMEAAYPPDRPAVEEALRRVMSGETDRLQIEHRVQDPESGVLRWIEATGQLFRTAQGEPYLISGLVRDITERKQTEELVDQLARSISGLTGDTFFRSLVEQLAHVLQADSILISETIPQVEPRRARVIALFSNQAGEPYYEFDIDGTVYDVVLQQGLRAYSANIIEMFPNDPLLKAKGIEGYVGAALIDSSGQAIGALEMLCRTPLTNPNQAQSLLQIFATRAAAELERRRIATELETREQQFHALIDQSADGILKLSENGSISYASPSALRLLGVENQNLSGQSMFQFFVADDLPLLRQMWQQLLDQPEQPMTVQFRYRHADGSLRWAEATSKNSLQDPIVQGVVTNFRDITLRKQAEESLRQHLEQLEAIRTVDVAITSSLDLNVTLNVILKQVIHQLGADATTILLYDENSQELHYGAGQGMVTRDAYRVRLRLRDEFAGRVAFERRTVLVSDLSQRVLPDRVAIAMARENIQAYAATPLIAKGRIKGVLEVFFRQPFSFTADWQSFLETLASQAAIAIDNNELFENLQQVNLEMSQAYDATLQGWVRAIDLRDQETEGHTLRVADLTLQLADELHVNASQLSNLWRGALLHDVGKIAIPDHVLQKPGPLSTDEWALMRQHPVYAYELLAPIQFLREAIIVPYYHHERWNGTGYPHQLRGEEIPMLARLFAVVDVWDALNHDRPYRPAWPRTRVVEFLRRSAGELFDPQVVNAFLKIAPGHNGHHLSARH